MVAQAIDYRRHVRRPVGFVLLGLVLLITGGYLLFDVSRHRANIETVPSAYTYTVNQLVEKSVTYFPNSFYNGGPGLNSGYIMELTDKLKTTFHYKF